MITNYYSASDANYGAWEASKDIQHICDTYKDHNSFDTDLYNIYPVARGLRNANGTGVVAGLTQICNVHGYVMDEGEKSPVEGSLSYRGIDINDLVDGCIKENRFGFEEAVWLLLVGKLPTREQLEIMHNLMTLYEDLPENFTEDILMKTPSPQLMVQLARGVLALSFYDNKADDLSIENQVRQSLSVIARLPNIMVTAYQIKRRYWDKQSMYFHQPLPEYSIAQNILRMLRADTQFTEEEARLLDICMILHAEHGGGNNSTFATRVLSSSGTDLYSSIAAGIGSLKGPRHGGANKKVREMVDFIKEGVKDWGNDAEMKDFLYKLMKKEAGDRSGLIYGMGHAVYTKSDPRAVILKRNARKLAKDKGFYDDFALLESIERLTPEVFSTRGNNKIICANVDLYSGLVYEMLGIPDELHTPLFAVARSAGWCAHRIEELTIGGRLIRPAYKAVLPKQSYIPMSHR